MLVMQKEILLQFVLGSPIMVLNALDYTCRGTMCMCASINVQFRIHSVEAWGWGERHLVYTSRPGDVRLKVIGRLYYALQCGARSAY